MQPLFNSFGKIIEEDGSSHSIENLLNLGDNLFANIPSRSLALLFCQNQYESVFFYVNAIQRGIVPILVDSSVDITLLFKIIHEYQPEFVFTQISNREYFSNFSEICQFKNFRLWKNNKVREFNLHPNLCLLLSTSGTTGSPKLVRLSYENLISNATSIVKYLQLNSTEIAITSLPMNYSFGLSVINSHLSAGGSILLTNETITQRKFWELFKKYKINSFSGVPYTFDILNKFRLLNQDLPNLKTITQAGGKLSDEMIRKFAQLSLKNNWDFFVMYGQTEATARLSYLEPQFVIDKLGSIGKPISGGSFYIIDKNGIKINQPRISGELVYTGANVMLGYAENAMDMIKSNENNGILHTGDIAYFDEDGFYFITGRIKRFIKIFGNRVNLDEIEYLLCNREIEAVCTGRDNYLQVCILKVGDKDSTIEFLTKTLGIHISIINVKVIDAIPKNSAGKTIYTNLMD